MSRRLGLLCGVLALTLVLRVWLGAVPAVPLRSPLSAFPVVLGDWGLVQEVALEDRTLSVLGADEYLVRWYQDRRGGAAELYIGYYRDQRTGDTMHSPKNCLPGAGWQAVRSGRVKLFVPGRTTPVEVNRYVVEKDDQQALVLYWYQAHGRVIASEYWGKVFLVWDSLWRHRRDGAIVRVLVPVHDNLSQAEARGREFARVILPELPRFLPD